MDDYIARQFWVRVDNLRSNISLKEIASTANINYNSLRNKRSGKIAILPNLQDSYAIARALNTSIEFLLTGENFQEVFCAEARAVNEDPELQALVRAVMKDRRLLSALASVITSMEHASAGLA